MKINKNVLKRKYINEIENELQRLNKEVLKITKNLKNVKDFPSSREIFLRRGKINKRSLTYKQAYNLAYRLRKITKEDVKERLTSTYFDAYILTIKSQWYETKFNELNKDVWRDIESYISKYYTTKKAKYNFMKEGLDIDLTEFYIQLTFDLKNETSFATERLLNNLQEGIKRLNE